ncbi:MAG: nucleotidyltransferase family protein [Winogradskyella sp.]|uniref:nucleotidyltransferase family protein n=1 Tax=Winogradskyella sp. TaxID=1883156 RepID=UPI0017A7EAF8|nr:nucleotidyltransferase family protein [Winogradskyella sp.]
MKTAILILAAGASSRMKSPKLLLPYKNRTLIGWSISHALASKANHVSVVLNNETTKLKTEVDSYDVRAIINANFKNGLSSSIAAGVKEFILYDAILITLADQPNVDAIYLNKMIDYSITNPNTVIGSKYKEAVGVPALFPKTYFNELLNLDGDTGAKTLLNNESIPVLTIASKVNLFDVDTPKDYSDLINKIDGKY